MSKKIEKTRYSDPELQEFKEIIDGKLANAKEQLSFYLKQKEEKVNSGGAKLKGLGDGKNTVESEHLSTMTARQRKHIQHLENALIRIENKVFGVCRVTGKLISKERLKAVPHATMSIDAKQSKK